ncbi:MAG: hypothetical protein ACFCD0_15085 [Gemmataceae bacterium]
MASHGTSRQPTAAQLSESVAEEQSLVPGYHDTHLDGEFSDEIRSINVVRPDATAMEVFFAWEKMRVAYNGILVCCSLALGALFGTITEPGFWPLCIAGAIFLNVCYCVGPVMEGYMVWILKAERKPSRILVFLGGLSLSVISVMGALARIEPLF